MFCNQDHYGKPKRFMVFKIIGWVIGGIVLAVIFALLFAIVFVKLWNWIMPDLFGLKTIGFWQAFGIIVLAKVLFGNFGHHHPHHDRKRGIKEKIKGHFCNDDDIEGYEDFINDKKYFKRFWEEEGSRAFKDYIDKNKDK